MQAIITKFHGATDTRGARISATSESGVRVYVPYPEGLSAKNAHWVAVEQLLKRLDWIEWWWFPGALPHGYAWVSAYPDQPFWGYKIGESTSMELVEE